jgi:hypothetical protein
VAVEGIDHGRWIVEGSLDDLECLVGVIDHVVVPESQHEPPVIEEPTIALSILGSIVVAIPVDLDRKPPLKAYEVSDERTDWLLPPETHSELPSPKMTPQNRLTLRRILPHLSSESK